MTRMPGPLRRIAFISAVFARVRIRLQKPLAYRTTMRENLAMQVDYINLHERADRSGYIYATYQRYFGSRVLDVGCDQALLKDLAPGMKYTGVDMGGKADVVLNLDKIERLPFDNDSFDCVICSDVLEHLDNLHLVFSELIRVSNRYIIISWPNAWMAARIPMQRGEGSFRHYGLPPEKPADRHKWFFNLSEAMDFVRSQMAKRRDIELVEQRVTERPRPAALRMLRRLRYPNQRKYLNRYAHTLWTVLKKNGPD